MRLNFITANASRDSISMPGHPDVVYLVGITRNQCKQSHTYIIKLFCTFDDISAKLQSCVTSCCSPELTATEHDTN